MGREVMADTLSSLVVHGRSRLSGCGVSRPPRAIFVFPSTCDHVLNGKQRGPCDLNSGVGVDGCPSVERFDGEFEQDMVGAQGASPGVRFDAFPRFRERADTLFSVFLPAESAMVAASAGCCMIRCGPDPTDGRCPRSTASLRFNRPMHGSNAAASPLEAGPGSHASQRHRSVARGQYHDAREYSIRSGRSARSYCRRSMRTSSPACRRAQ